MRLPKKALVGPKLAARLRDPQCHTRSHMVSWMLELLLVRLNYLMASHLESCYDVPRGRILE